MPELLLELLSEEIPARMQARAAEDLKRLVCDGLDEKGLGNYFSEARSFVTPRRLALVIDDLPERQMARVEVRKGPRSDASEQAIKGFKGKLPKGAKVKVRETTKGTFLFASIHKSAQPTPEVLPGIVEAALAALSWPKSMRWSHNEDALLLEDSSYLLLEGGGKLLLEPPRWVRPLRAILCIFDGTIVPVEFASVEASNTAVGHPFLSPKPFKVKDFADYKTKLEKAKVILSAAERRRVIEKEAARLAKAEGLTVRPDPELVAENAGLVEWPVVLMGRIEPEFMGLPPEVLTTTMRHHQKYFALLDKKGKLAPRFLVVAGTRARDKGKQIIAGNERVLRARLADAKFFWDQDRKRTLESRVGDLDGIVFHAKLGSLGEKVRHIEVLAANIAESLSFDADATREAARLCKADLTTEMVGEFPELQGVMGRYYALGEGKPTAVADAIAEHYAPLGPNDDCPNAPVSVAVALADKIDTLFWFFAIGQLPTGSKDPFALRRGALGVIRLIIENGLRLSLRDLFHSARMLGREDLARHATIDPSLHIQGIINDLVEFIADRLKVHLKEKGVRHDLISAVFALTHEDDLVRVLARVYALQAFLGTDDGEDLLTAYRRASKIVRIEEKKDGRQYREVEESLLIQKEEIDLWLNLEGVKESFEVSLNAELFTESMAGLAQLRHPIDRFFDNVTVNVSDDSGRRENRLGLLRHIVDVMNKVADFSKIEGGER